jgi:hypothetical protein
MFKNLPLDFIQILNSPRELSARAWVYQVLALWKSFMFMQAPFKFGTKCTILHLNFLRTTMAETITKVYAKDHGAKQHLGFQAYVGRWIDGPCGTSHWPFHTCLAIQIKTQTCSYDFWWNMGYRCWGEVLHPVRVLIFFALRWVMEPCHPMLVYSHVSKLF